MRLLAKREVGLVAYRTGPFGALVRSQPTVVEFGAGVVEDVRGSGVARRPLLGEAPPKTVLGVVDPPARDGGQPGVQE